MDEQIIRRRRSRHHIWTGLFLLLVGGVLLMRQTGFPFPEWLFTWPSVVIAVGLFVGARHGFRDLSWLILILIGFIFLSEHIWPEFHLKQYAVPAVIITVGLIFLLAPRKICHPNSRMQRMKREKFRRRFREWQAAAEMSEEQWREEEKKNEMMQEAVLDITSVFAGIKKTVLSKQFNGGEVVCFFGGAEINLTNADFVSPIVIDIVNVFGGTKLIIPANWEIRSEITAIFGGVDDKRRQGPDTVSEKTIILKGTNLFGGVEIISY
jgi:predicted membrane protein